MFQADRLVFRLLKSTIRCSASELQWVIVDENPYLKKHLMRARATPIVKMFSAFWLLMMMFLEVHWPLVSNSSISTCWMIVECSATDWCWSKVEQVKNSSADSLALKLLIMNAWTVIWTFSVLQWFHWLVTTTACCWRVCTAVGSSSRSNCQYFELTT